MTGLSQAAEVIDFVKAKKPLPCVAKLGELSIGFFPGSSIRGCPIHREGVTIKRRTKGKKPAATRQQVYWFAQDCIERGYPEAAAVAVICFEWLQRPENVIAGYLRWNDYQSKRIAECD